MRLIDADWLNKELQKRIGSPTDDKLYEVNLCIIDAPTIDAIPVEWAKAQIKPYAGDASDIGQSVRNGTIKDLIRKWQKEQEDDDAQDALALLKVQESRLVTAEDFANADKYGFLPVWTEEKDGDLYCECIPSVAITDEDYKAQYRFWTSCPTDEQREAIAWEA